MILVEEGQKQFVTKPQEPTAYTLTYRPLPPSSRPDPPPTSSAPDPIVREIQRQLHNLGYDAGTIDGIVGNKTRNAVMSFQRDFGMDADGRPTEIFLTDLLKKVPRCEYKGVMSDEDYRNCGIDPPQVR